MTRKCPECGRGKMEHRNGVWKCLWGDCGYREKNCQFCLHKQMCNHYNTIVGLQLTNEKLFYADDLAIICDEYLTRNS